MPSFCLRQAQAAEIPPVEPVETCDKYNLSKCISMKGYLYILLCDDGSYYTGSTTDLELRLEQHFNGEGANHTKKHKLVKLLYCEEFDRIDEAYYREKQVQGWSRKKKEALINGQYDLLPELSRSKKDKSIIPPVEPVETSDK